MKKRKLEVEFDFDFTLFGLISALKEYKLAWLLNNQFNIQLDKARDIEIDFLKSQNLVISNYLYETEHSSFRLLKNKSLDLFKDNLAFLIPELKRFDYLVVIQGFEDTFTDDGMKEILSSVPKVQYVQKFQVEDLKSKENLIF